MTRPTPLHLRLLRGNPSKRPIRDEPEPAIEAQVPDPPVFVAGYAADEWYRIGPHLHRLGLLTVLDTMPLAAYCVSYSRWRHAEETLASAAAATVTAADGTLRVHPLLKISRDAAKDMLRFAAEFGLTPVARSRLAAGGYTPPTGPGKFDGFLS